METNNLLSLLGNVLDEKNIGQISQALGSDNSKTKKAIAAALPELLGALSKNTATSEGADNLSGALEKDHDGTILDNISDLAKDPEALKWGKILDHILWAAKNEVASKVATKTGLWEKQSADLLKTLWPILLGALWKAKKDGNLSSQDLTELLTKSSGASNIFVKFLDTDGDGDFDKADMLTMAFNYIKKNFLSKK